MDPSPANQLQIINYPMMQIQTWDDIEVAINSHPNTKRIVCNNVDSYQSVNVADTMTKLSQIGDLLKLAYCGAKGHKCCSKITIILTHYQPLINSSSSVCDTFVEASIKALKSFRLALLAAEKETGIPIAMKMISNTTAIAHTMAELSQKMVDQSEVLYKESSDALVSAVDEEYQTGEKKNQIEAEMGKLKSQQSKLTQQTADLATAITEAKEEEAKLIKQANEIRQKAFAVSLVSSIVQPITSGLATIGAAYAAGPIAAATTVISGLLSFRKNKEPTANKIGEDLQSSLNKILETQEKTNEGLANTNKSLAQEKASLIELKKTFGEEQNEIAKKALGDEITATEKRIVDLEEEAKAKEKFIVDLQTSLNKVTDLLNDQVKGFEKREENIAKQRADLQKEQRSANADLAGTIIELQNSENNIDHLKQSIKSLEIVVKTLGKIGTVFGNTRLFWERVEKHCKSLADFKNFEDTAMLAELAPEYKIEFINAIKSTGLSWLALAEINRVAAISMGKVKQNVDGIMNNLPSHDEAMLLIKPLAEQMLIQIEEENKVIEIN